MSKLAISVKNVTVKYGTFKALKNINFAVETGKIVGILGPNGAGKSTLVDTVIGAKRVATGTVETLGVDPITDAAMLRTRLGIVLQSAGFPAGMKVSDILYSWRYYVPKMTKKDVMKIAEDVNLCKVINRPLSALSGGERRRVDIAIALYGQPSLIVLDEPTTGLDPISRENVWNIIRRQRDNGTTVLLTSHYLDEIQSLSDTVIVIASGEITASGTVAELSHSLKTPRKCTISASDTTLTELASLLGALPSLRYEGGEVSWESIVPAQDIRRIMTYAHEHDLSIEDLTVDRPSLSSAYKLLIESSNAASAFERRRGNE